MEPKPVTPPRHLHQRDNCVLLLILKHVLVFMKITHRLALATALVLLPAYVHAEPAAASSQPNDAQIAAIVVTANQVDIDAGKWAAVNTADSAVKKFAAMMVTDHTSVNQSAVALVTKLKVTPEANATSKA